MFEKMPLETANQTTQSEREAWDEFVRMFCDAASFQGRLAYCLMSIHAVNPRILEYFTSWNPVHFLFSNMVYGIAIFIASRPSLTTIVPLQRISFGLFGSLAFNYSTMMFYDYLIRIFAGRPILLTFLGYLSGRIMLVHLLAFIYHMDTRCTTPGVEVPRSRVYEAMYLRND